MLLLLLSFLLAAVVVTHFEWMDNFVTVILGMFLAMILFFASSGAYDVFSDSPYKVSDRSTMVALADGSGTTGHFGLFSGVIGKKNYYVYYYSKNGVIRQGKVEVEYAVIIEGGETPEVLTYSDPGDGINWIGLRFGSPDYYEFHVPKGTVVQQFKLDLGN